MKRLALSSLAIVMFSGTAFAMPILNPANSMAPPTLVENARIVCEESGMCYRLPTRRPLRAGSMAMAHFMDRTTVRVTTVRPDVVMAGLSGSGGNRSIDRQFPRSLEPLVVGHLI